MGGHQVQGHRATRAHDLCLDWRLHPLPHVDRPRVQPRCPAPSGRLRGGRTPHCPPDVQLLRSVRTSLCGLGHVVHHSTLHENRRNHLLLFKASYTHLTVRALCPRIKNTCFRKKKKNFFLKKKKKKKKKK